MIIGSPCVGICTIDPKNKLCKGCFRTRLEMFQWSTYDDNKKIDIIDRITFRKEIYGIMPN